jgi:hypothetical protein
MSLELDKISNGKLKKYLSLDNTCQEIASDKLRKYLKLDDSCNCDKCGKVQDVIVLGKLKLCKMCILEVMSDLVDENKKLSSGQFGLGKYLEGKEHCSFGTVFFEGQYPDCIKFTIAVSGGITKNRAKEIVSGRNFELMLLCDKQE